MSESKTIKNPSALVLAILALDEHFTDLNRLAVRVDEIDMKSNFDFEQSERLITLFAEAGQAVSTDIAQFVTVLNEARSQAEAASEKVAIKAEQLRSRKENTQSKMDQFHALSARVGQLNESLLQFKRPEGETLTEQDRAELKFKLSEIGSVLQSFIAEAGELKKAGQEAKIKILEQNADSMRQALLAVNKKITEMDLMQ